MGDTNSQQLAGLQSSIEQHLKGHSAHYVDATSSAAKLLLMWIHYLRSIYGDNHAAQLLNAVQATIIEVSGCLSLGLVRPAIFSLRTQLELMLAWMYFNDHPVEWDHIQAAIDDFPLRGQNIKYLSKFVKGFDKRYSLLSKKINRSKEDPYGILSVHVHGTSTLAAPALGDLSTLVRKKKDCDDCLRMAEDVAEYLCDVLASRYADLWHDLPKDIQVHISSRLTGKDLKTFCE